MEEVKGLYAVGDGVPPVLGATWRPAVLQTMARKDPFSGKIVSAPHWIATAGGHGERVAGVYSELVLAKEPAWAEPARLMGDRVAGFHTGIVVELWSVIVGAETALSAWKPSWLTPDREALLIAFPARVTQWLAELQEADASAVISAWAEMPYMDEAAGPDALMICRTFLSLVQPIGRVARERGGNILMCAGGYVLP
jgi:hypothetical protein